MWKSLNLHILKEAIVLASKCENEVSNIAYRSGAETMLGRISPASAAVVCGRSGRFHLDCCTAEHEINSPKRPGLLASSHHGGHHCRPQHTGIIQTKHFGRHGNISIAGSTERVLLAFVFSLEKDNNAPMTLETE